MKKVYRDLVDEFLKAYPGFDGEALENVEFDIDDETVLFFDEIEEGKWDDQGKYQYQEKIFELTITTGSRTDDEEALGIFFRQSCQRSGSYFSHQEFQHEKPEEVRLHEYTKTINVREWI